ncbi:hypothetical protein BGZ94_004715, partial [Podila epigama]
MSTSQIVGTLYIRRPHPMAALTFPLIGGRLNIIGRSSRADITVNLPILQHRHIAI